MYRFRWVVLGASWLTAGCSGSAVDPADASDSYEDTARESDDLEEGSDTDIGGEQAEDTDESSNDSGESDDEQEPDDDSEEDTEEPESPDTGEDSAGHDVEVTYSAGSQDLPATGTSGDLVTFSDWAPSGMIRDVNVSIDLDHSCTKDLSAVLESPGGTRVVLFDLRGLPVCSSDMENTVLDDEAPRPILRGRSPFQGSHKPTERLADFDGEDASGHWTLIVSDHTIGDSGKLHSWSLQLVLE